MQRQNIPFVNPNQFFEEFVSNEAFNTSIQKDQNAEHNFFAIMRLEEFVKFIKFPILPTRSTVYHFCWLKKGTMQRCIGLKHYTITANTICFYNAGDILHTESCSEDAEGYYGVFDKEFISHFLGNQNSLATLPFLGEDGNPLIALPEPINNEVAQLLLKIDQEYKGNLPDRDLLIGTILNELLLRMKRLNVLSTDKQTYSTSQLLTQRFMQHLKMHALKQRSVVFYADLLSVTANHLNKCVKECTGKPVSAHIIAMVILEAKVMLKHVPIHIAEVAMLLYFEDVSYFTRFFKKHTGITPTQYRKSNNLLGAK